MRLSLRLILAFAGVFAAGFGAVGYAAIWITGETVERDLERRIDLTLRSVESNPAFFLIEASLREAELRQLADISGFEIVVPSPGGPGSSLAPETARELLATAPAGDRFTTTLDGVTYRGARATVRGRTLLLLSPAAPVERAKDEARRSVVVVAGLGLLAAVLLGVVLARTVTRPLRRLVDRAAEVREGRLDVPIPRGGGREVDALARGFEEMLAGLARYREALVKREKLATLGRFSASVAHEIRNPLSSLRMTVQMLRREAGEALAADLDFLLLEMTRLDHSVEELLFHAGTPQYEMVETDLGVVVEETVRSLAPLADHLSVGLETELPETPVRARADPGKLKQALTNLVLNALQASGPDQTVTLALRRDEDRAIVTVRDRGPGVPDSIAGRVFEPFVTGRDGGTGIWLAVAHSIAEAHEGEVAFARCEDTTVFTVRLPLSRG